MSDFGTYILEKTQKLVQKSAMVKGALTLWVESHNLHELVMFLRDDVKCQFKQLIDLCGVDYPGRPLRFDVVYHLLSLKFNQRLVIKLETAAETSVPSLVNIFSAANWPERETYEMYGLLFEGHPDMRRLLTDYGFEGHPLRKDFPLSGHVEIRYDETERRIVTEPVNLRQDFRQFDFESPWEGQWDKIGNHVLPGDEKATIDPIKRESA